MYFCNLNFTKMRKIKLLFLAVIATSTLFSCNSKKKDVSTPENATKTFVTAFYTGDFDEMYNCTVKNNRPIIQQMQKAMNTNKEKLESVRKNEIEVLDVTSNMINDSIAECECHFLYNKQKKKMTYNLRNEDDKWLVDLTVSY